MALTDAEAEAEAAAKSAKENNATQKALKSVQKVRRVDS